MEIKTTTNYDQFQLLAFNRDVKKTKKLEQSMKKHGYLNAYPLHVVKSDGGKYSIKGGHHRFVVASKLGIPVAYVVCNDNASIHELESATNQWNIDDYLTSFVRAENPHYIAVQRFSQRTGISVGLCVSMLGGEMASNFNTRDRFKAGTFKIVKDTHHAETVASIIQDLKNCGASWANSRPCVCAISRILITDCADINRLRKKIKAHSDMLSKKSSQEKYLELFENIYNRQVQGKKTPLAFLVNEAIKERSSNGMFKPKYK